MQDKGKTFSNLIDTEILYDWKSWAWKVPNIRKHFLRICESPSIPQKPNQVNYESPFIFKRLSSNIKVWQTFHFISSAVDGEILLLPSFWRSSQVTAGKPWDTLWDTCDEIASFLKLRGYFTSNKKWSALKHTNKIISKQKFVKYNGSRSFF